MLPQHIQSEKNFLLAVDNIIANLKELHKKEMMQLQKHHEDVVAELKQQASDAQKNFQDSLNKAQEQVKWSRRAYYVATATFIVTLILGFIKQ